jgi:hypothetical protein
VSYKINIFICLQIIAQPTEMPILLVLDAITEVLIPVFPLYESTKKNIIFRIKCVLLINFISFTPFLNRCCLIIFLCILKVLLKPL